jgi:hypothetical protein
MRASIENSAFAACCYVACDRWLLTQNWKASAVKVDASASQVSEPDNLGPPKL